MLRRENPHGPQPLGKGYPKALRTADPHGLFPAGTRLFDRGEKAFVLCALIYPASGTAAVLLSAVRKISISKR